MRETTSPRVIRKALSEAIWGYVFLYFNLNIGAVDLLPEFVGWILLLSAVRGLEGERRDLKLLRPFACVMIVLSVLEWLGSFLGLSVGGLFLPLDLVIAAVRLYFHFQFLTDCAALAWEYAAPVVRCRLLRWRTAQAVMHTVSMLLVCFLPGLEEWGSAVVAVLAGANIVVVLCVMAALCALRRLFPAGA